jgi:very-short-patch-repair endonuclease
MPRRPRRRLPRAERARIAGEVAADHDGVAHRKDLRSRGVSRADVRSEVAAGRWRTEGRHTVVIGTAVMSEEARRWHAVWESGPGAILDGVSALQAAGLRGFTSDAIDVSVPRGNRRHEVTRVRVRRRRVLGATIDAGVPRARPELAALRAAEWAATDRTAVLILCLVVQQRLVPPARLLSAWGSVRSSRRRTLLDRAISDICDGAHSLGELDFGALCRQAGLPSPSRQVVRTGPGGRVYLDVAWEDVGLVVEIDGGQHALALNPVDDALRQNEVTLGDDLVLRIPVLGLRLTPAAFMDQVVRAHARLAGRGRAA